MQPTSAGPPEQGEGCPTPEKCYRWGRVCVCVGGAAPSVGTLPAIPQQRRRQVLEFGGGGGGGFSGGESERGIPFFLFFFLSSFIYTA